ncbi:extracellular solute-binding protein [Acidisoma cellulosilytica]|uniref:Extracellular solute-binding protein n=1 Tax=Acidisoma cellulosilyticum TaxID=2802395 RepID=A0A963Z6L4_9PROT|nr:extracellular solute-binding protein [Acidisoma cellulosilyticum]MCB8883765.1 extracellular solute-binding protein [Acidisoma cellulosilyticum]
MRHYWINRLLAGVASLALMASAAWADDLVTPDRIGRADASHNFTFRVLTDESNSNAQPQFAAAMTALYEKYAKDHPDWRVNIELMSLQIPQEHARLLQQARNGTAPDCSSMDSFQVPLFIHQHLLQPVDPYFTDKDKAGLFPFVLPIISDHHGHIYAWWWTTDLRLLYRNTALVPQAPQTWAETERMALAAKSHGAAAGIMFNGGRNEITMIDFLPQFWAQGGKLIDDKGNPVFGKEPNRTYLLKAIAYYQQLIKSGAAPARVASISNYDDLTAAAIGGQTAMMVNGDWAEGQLQAAMKPEDFKNWAISMLPGPTADERATSSGGWTFVAFSKDPAKVKACMDLVREVYMGPAVVALKRLPTSEAVFDSDPMFATPFYQQIKTYLKDSHARPGYPIYTEISNQLQIAISEVLSGERRPDAALDTAVARVNRVAARYSDAAGSK